MNFFRTPKGLLTVILAILIALAAPHESLSVVLPGLLAAAAASAILDMVILRARSRKVVKVWEIPSGAILTAMIIAMVLRAQEPWYVVTITSLFAVVTKYVVRSRAANVFNPAALGIVVSYYVFHTGQSWWGALPEVSPAWVLTILLLTGVFITDRVNKMPLVLTFLGVYYALFTAAAFIGDPIHVSEIYRAPDLHASLFFAFIILTDPPTSPAKYPDQYIFGTIVAVVSFAIFQLMGTVYFLLAGVLVGNVWEAWRRANRRSGASFPQGLGSFFLEISPWLRAIRS